MRAATLLVVAAVLCSCLGSPVRSDDDGERDYVDQVQIISFVDLSLGNDTLAGNSTDGNSTLNDALIDPEPWRKLIDPLVHTCPMDCNYRGICDTGFCTCRYPFWGVACEREMCGPKQLCNDRGTCVNNTASPEPSHVCLCDDGWTGPYCDLADDECPYDCLDHGQCINGVCSCNKGWVGDYCETISCPMDCSGHGQCLQNGELGGYCNCSTPWYSESCAFALCPRNCSGNGVCDKYTGMCSCNETFVGTACELHLCPNNCSFPQGSCDLRSGACKCDPRYRAADCSEEVCPNVCSGRGTCHPTGLCECDPYFGGDDCSKFLCFHNCSMTGDCQFDGSCACDANFTGPICEVDLRCPNNCSGNGRCVHAQCNCTGGWSSWDCSVAPFGCPDDFHCVHGNCTSGACSCQRGWQGFDCNIAIPRMCSRNSDCYHGTCDDIGQCVCEWPWTGDFCERHMAHPLPMRDELGFYDIPDPHYTDTPAALEKKMDDFVMIPKSGRCGKYGDRHCASPIFRRPHPRTPSLRIPMGIRHTPNRAKANATHAANGTFWGDIWGNATAVWDEIHDKQEADREAAELAAENAAEYEPEPEPEAETQDAPPQQTAPAAAADTAAQPSAEAAQVAPTDTAQVTDAPQEAVADTAAQQASDTAPQADGGSGGGGGGGESAQQQTGEGVQQAADAAPSATSEVPQQEAEAAQPAAEGETVQQEGEGAQQASEGAQQDDVPQQEESPPTKHMNAIQTAHYHNLRSARKHYYNARRRKQAASNGIL